MPYWQECLASSCLPDAFNAMQWLMHQLHRAHWDYAHWGCWWPTLQNTLLPSSLWLPSSLCCWAEFSRDLSGLHHDITKCPSSHLVTESALSISDCSNLPAKKECADNITQDSPQQDSHLCVFILSQAGIGLSDPVEVWIKQQLECTII